MIEGWHSHNEQVAAALLEPSRRHRRMQNIAGIKRKLNADDRGEIILRPRKRARLERELGFLRIYDTRHPVHADALQMPIGIKFGLKPK